MFGIKIMEIEELKKYLEKRIQKFEKAAFTKKDGSSARAAAEDKAILRYIKSKEKKGVDYNKLQKQLDEVLAKETKESWDEYLKEEHHGEEFEEFILKLHNKYKDVGFSKLLDIACDVSKWQIKDMLEDAISSKVLWYDGFMLDYTQEQLDEALQKIGADINDMVRVIIIKDK